MPFPWMIPERNLKDEQNDFLNVHLRRPGNIWIQGHAGSGKSLLLVHSVNNSLLSNRNLKIAVVVFTHALIDLLGTGLREIGLENITIMTYFEFKENNERYDIIFVDEVQDLPEDILRKMKSRAGRIIAAGDQMQSIYPHRASPEQIKSTLFATEYPLNDIHRLTKSIVTIVVQFLGNIGNILNGKIIKADKDKNVNVGHASDKKTETEYIWRKSKEFVAVESTVILLPKHDEILDFFSLVCQFEDANEWRRKYVRKAGRSMPDYDSLNEHCNDHEIPFEYVGNDFGSLDNAWDNHKVILMTYHSAKGLDFENVFIPWLTDRLRIVGKTDKLKETVFMVALTRSRNSLFLTYHGDGCHPYLYRFIDEDCVYCFDVDKALLELLDEGPGGTTEW